MFTSADNSAKIWLTLLFCLITDLTYFRAMFGSLFIDIDFSENLKLPVKFEPQ